LHHHADNSGPSADTENGSYTTHAVVSHAGVGTVFRPDCPWRTVWRAKARLPHSSRVPAGTVYSTYPCRYVLLMTGKHKRGLAVCPMGTKRRAGAGLTKDDWESRWSCTVLVKIWSDVFNSAGKMGEKPGLYQIFTDTVHYCSSVRW